MIQNATFDAVFTEQEQNEARDLWCVPLVKTSLLGVLVRLCLWRCDTMSFAYYDVWRHSKATQRARDPDKPDLKMIACTTISISYEFLLCIKSVSPAHEMDSSPALAAKALTSDLRAECLINRGVRKEGFKPLTRL